MNITLADFQLKAINQLMEAMENEKREIVLKSCTGSGKTIILTHFIDEYCKSYSNIVFVWLTPGRGELEEQSKAKMDKYIHGSQTKLLSDIMTSGFEENDACFINWEKLTKKDNNALKDSEHTNFLEHIQKALDRGLKFNIIVDESHTNDTIKANDILGYFQTHKIIRSSATPIEYRDAEMIEIPEEDVIAAGLIKKVLIINENFKKDIHVDNQIDYLIEKALQKQRDLHSILLNSGVDINPLIIVQIPNNSEILQDQVERYFESKVITYENGMLAVRLSGKHENLDDIEKPNAKPIAIIIKQSVAVGWDCPRAYILVKLRDNMSETFEIQTIGRIRRMPEAKHYDNELLDSCYLYTLDERFTEGVKMHLGKGALDAMKLYLKEQYKKIKLISEKRSGITIVRDSKETLKVIYDYFKQIYKITDNTEKNKKIFEAYGFIFGTDIIIHTKTGEIETFSQSEINKLSKVNIHTQTGTHEMGRQYHHNVAEIGLKINLAYHLMNTIIRRLFDKNTKHANKILLLETREVYAFIINNQDLLKDTILSAMSAIITDRPVMTPAHVAEKDFYIPQECMFTYDGRAKAQYIMAKNVYKGYLSSAEIRSDSEKSFEKFCETRDNIEWVHKNGDKGDEYFSVVYEDNFGKQRVFYPDYIVGTNSGIWVIETKGGFTKTGKSEDIDIFSPRKFEVLIEYLRKYNLNGGFVREDKQSQELCICTDEFNDNIKSNNWRVLKEIL